MVLFSSCTNMPLTRQNIIGVNIMAIFHARHKNVLVRPQYAESQVKLSHYTPCMRDEEKRYTSHSFLTSALDGVWSASRPGRALATAKGPPVNIG
jgi:hypothetical protein